jgi:hypothetical protein
MRTVGVKQAVLVLPWRRRHDCLRPLHRVVRFVTSDLAGKGAAVGQTSSHRWELGRVQGHAGRNKLDSSASAPAAAEAADAAASSI